jgi:hypothetical protein
VTGAADPKLLTPLRLRSLRIVLVFMVLGNFLLAAHLWEDALRGYADFAAFYVAGNVLRHDSASLYDFQKQSDMRAALLPEAHARNPRLPYYHPAFEAAVYAVLAALPYQAAYLAWLIANLLLLGLALWWLRGFVAHSGMALLVLASFAFFPIIEGLLQGQDAVLLLALYAIAFAALRREREFLSGLVLAVGLFKFHLVVPFVIIMAAQRRWKLVGGFAAGAAVLAAISVALTGMGGARQYFELMLHFDRFTGAATSNLDSQMPSLGGFLSTSLGPIAGAGATKLLIMLGSAGMAAAAAYLARYARHDLALTFAFSMTATLLAAYHVNTHDLALLLPALLLAIDRASNRQNLAVLALVALILGCAPIYILLIGKNLLTLMFWPLLALYLLLARQLPVTSSPATLKPATICA